MTNQLRKLTTLVAVGFFASASSAALANGIETQYSIYDLAAQANAASLQAGQAGPSGSSALPAAARAPSDWVSTETQYSVYHIAWQAAAAPVGQAGRAGPDAVDYSARKSGSIETQFSIYDLDRRF